MSRIPIWALAVLALLGAASASPQAAAQPSPWTTQDVIDERIDVYAQYALMRMFGKDPVAAAAASAMLSAVKEGKLAGIYQPDQKVPALRAQAMGKGWWQLLPAGADAVCVGGPEGAAPLIVFRKEAKSLSYRLDPALRVAWAACGLAWAEPRGYRATLPPKQPAVPPPVGQPTTLTVLVLDSGNAPVAGASVHIMSAGVPAGGSVTDAAGSATVNLGPGVYSVVVEAPASHGGGSTYLAAQVEEGRSNFHTVSLGGAAGGGPAVSEGGPLEIETRGAVMLSPDCAAFAANCAADCTRTALRKGEECAGDPGCLALESAHLASCVARCEAETLSCERKRRS